ncbi:Hsp20 family protein [Paremcibacter congregatus]|uniref:Heat-shock protein n=1 Tax=Paremcibacter congregatus TaxID=2043170 RepID=A0A2G4YV25_9PROT|nr:Hsp20 family protein [Paremcibacter congregatus]PHZ86192.1 heat-shock protein [Paremcibacter congregatus]QDE27156.1 Hsp20 family protein [Paremcibacter congregatus]
MRSMDLTPLLRSSIGFDHINRLLDNALASNEATYPPYNIEKLSEDDYRITVALAGFAEEDLDVSISDGVLIVSANNNQDQTEEAEDRYLHRGIAKRSFERRFRLAETIRVMGATLENGLLTIDLQREVPEHLKPRKIKISSGDTSKKAKIVDHKAA